MFLELIEYWGLDMINAWDWGLTLSCVVPLILFSLIVLVVDKSRSNKCYDRR
jgi:hypothetical protein